MPAPLRVAVAGASGYIGAQCVALLDGHPGVEITQLSGRSAAGKRHCDVVPGSAVEMTLSSDIDAHEIDAVFACLPHMVAAGAASDWLDAGAVVLDLSADFRLRDPADYQVWYGGAHPAPHLLDDAVYALPELPSVAIADSRVLAMPGCYATATLLACSPALVAGIGHPALIVDAKSGVSGAGRSPSLTTHYGEASESVRAYSADGHRHTAEVLQELRSRSTTAPTLTFVPHLVPMTRGILVTAYIGAMPGADRGDFETLYREFCADRVFLRYESSPPSTKSVSRTNVAAINVAWQNQTAIVTCVIDNLIKGAAGQALQAFNIRFGFPESMGLALTSLWP